MTVADDGDELTELTELAMNGRLSVEKMAIYHCRAIPLKYAAEKAMDAEDLQMKIQDNMRQKLFNDQKRRFTTGRRAAHLAMRLKKENCHD